MGYYPRLRTPLAPRRSRFARTLNRVRARNVSKATEWSRQQQLFLPGKSFHWSHFVCVCLGVSPVWFFSVTLCLLGRKWYLCAPGTQSDRIDQGLHKRVVVDLHVL